MAAGRYAPAMVRVTEIRLPLDHDREALSNALRTILGVPAIGRISVARRGYDARQRSAIRLVYTVDAEVADEAAFLAAAERELKDLGVRGRAICGRWQSLEAQELVGCSLMVDQLSPEDALVVLECGLGRHRRLGCGLFVPHKSSAAVGAA